MKIGSKDSHLYFPSNRANRFAVRLDSPLIFTEAYEVGVSRVMYTPQLSTSNFFRRKEDRIINVVFEKRIEKQLIIEKITDDVEKFLNFVNQKSQADGFRLKLTGSVSKLSKDSEEFLELTVVNSSNYTIEVDEDLAYVLGFNASSFAIGETKSERAASPELFKKLDMSRKFVFQHVDSKAPVKTELDDLMAYKFFGLVTELNLKLLTSGIKFTGKNNLLTVTNESKRKLTLTFSEFLGEMLGVKELNLKENEKRELTFNTVLDHGNPYLVVQTSLVEPTWFGNRLLPVLKILPPANDEAQKYYNYEHVEYYLVNKSYVAFIEIDITEDNGSPAKLQEHPVDMILNFRPCSKQA